MSFNKLKKYSLPGFAFLVLLLIMSLTLYTTVFAAPAPEQQPAAASGQELDSGAILENDGEDTDIDDFLTDEVLSETNLANIAGTLGEVFLISGDVIEIEYSELVTKADAEALLTVTVDKKDVDWEFLSYFDFGSYGERDGVINIRLKEGLDVGEPRGRRRTSSAESFLARTEHIKGPEAAILVNVSIVGS
jgi:hypothetical protein